MVEFILIANSLLLLRLLHRRLLYDKGVQCLKESLPKDKAFHIESGIVLLVVFRKILV